MLSRVKVCAFFLLGHQVYSKIEQDMELLGVTAIEDKLQDGVPDAIADLANVSDVMKALILIPLTSVDVFVALGRFCLQI